MENFCSDCLYFCEDAFWMDGECHEFVLCEAPTSDDEACSYHDRYVGWGKPPCKDFKEGVVNK